MAAALKSPAASKLGDPSQPPVEVTCTGPFYFDFIKYVASFDENVEVRFFPVQKLRAFEPAYFCAGPPAFKPHIIAQVVVEARSSRSFVLDLPLGDYDMRDEALGLEHVCRVKVTPSGAASFSLRLGDKPTWEEPLRLAPGATLVLENPRGSFETLRFETFAHRLGATTEWQYRQFCIQIAQRYNNV